MSLKPILALGEDLAAGRTSSRALVDQCLDRISDPAGEGSRVFIQVDADGARSAADRADVLRDNGISVSPLAGIPVSVKDLFDVAGQVTRVGSKVVDDGPAKADAPSIARLRAAGMIIMGRTNMTEFAFSGLGINPHYGTPSSPWDRETGRVPGGSSSGAAVSVADGMAAAGMGTDTGGSCRIPAHCCGVTGYKPSSWRVPREGVYPLSSTLDSVGPLAKTVACCAMVDAALAGEAIEAPRPIGPKGLRLAVPQTLVLDDLDDDVAKCFERALKRLSHAGVLLEDIACSDWGDLPSINAKGGIAAAEAFALHRDLLASDGDGYDQRVRGRIMGGDNQSAADYIDTLNARSRMIGRFEREAVAFDAYVLPTVAQIAPAIEPIVSGSLDNYVHNNMRMLRNTSVGNFLDGCAITVPCHEPGNAPVGLMLMAANGQDRHLFSVATAVESAIAHAG